MEPEETIEMWACDAHLSLACYLMLGMSPEKVIEVRMPIDLLTTPESKVARCNFCNAPARFMIKGKGPPLPPEERGFRYIKTP